MRHGHSRTGDPSARALLRDQRGLSTIEYILAATLLGVVGLIAWEETGVTVRGKVEGATDTTIASLRTTPMAQGSTAKGSAANANGNPSHGTPGVPAAPQTTIASVASTMGSPRPSLPLPLPPSDPGGGGTTANGGGFWGGVAATASTAWSVVARAPKAVVTWTRNADWKQQAKDLGKCAVIGDFGNCDSVGGFVGNVGGGMVMSVYRGGVDVAAAAYNYWNGNGSILNVGAASLAMVPIVGKPASKAAQVLIKHGDEVFKYGDEAVEAVAAIARRAGSHVDEAEDAVKAGRHVGSAAKHGAEEAAESTSTVAGAARKLDDATSVPIRTRHYDPGWGEWHETAIPMDANTPVYRVQLPEQQLVPHQSSYFQPEQYGLRVQNEYEALYVSTDKEVLRRLRQGQGYFDDGAIMTESTMGEVVERAGPDARVYVDEKFKWSVGADSYVIVRPKATSQ